MYQQGKEAYDTLSDQVVFVNTHKQESVSEQKKQTQTVEPEKLDIQVDFTTLKKENKDITGWIYCPGTVINYPIVQGADNEYYLTHTFEGKENQNGCIFLNADNNNDYSDSNSFLYGHHMKNGSMFASLLGYREQEYYEEHPVIYIATPDKTYELQLFAAFTTSAYSDIYRTSFENEEDFRQWMNVLMKKNNIHTDQKVSFQDQIVTLSTCEYSYDDGRYVVMGVLKEQTDEDEIMISLTDDGNLLYNHIM